MIYVGDNPAMLVKGNYEPAELWGPKIVQTTGAQLLPKLYTTNISSLNPDGSINLLIENTQYISLRLINIDSITLLAGHTYTLSISKSMPCAVRASNVLRITSGNTSITQTMSADTVIDHIAIDTTIGASHDVSDVFLILNEGTEALPWEPYSGGVPAIVPVGPIKYAGWRAQDYTGKEITVQDTYNDRLCITARGEHSQRTTTGKNLLDMSKANGYVPAYGLEFSITSDGAIRLRGTSTRTGKCSFRIAWLYDESDKLINLGANVIGFGQPDGYMIIDVGTRTMTIQAITLAEGNDYDFLIYPMAYTGDTPDKWEPYTGVQPAPNPDYPQEIEAIDSLDISVNGVQQTYPFSPPLYGADGVYDTWENDVTVDGIRRGRLTRRWKRLVLDGTENFRLDASYPQVFYLPLRGVNWNTIPYCSHYKRGTSAFSSVSDSTVNISSGVLAIGIKDTRYADTMDFKSFLSAQYAAGTPVTIVYQLETPEITLGDPVPLRTRPQSTAIVSNVELTTNIKTVEH